MSRVLLCAHCGGEFTRALGHNRATTCSPGCSAELKRHRDRVRRARERVHSSAPAARICIVCRSHFQPARHHPGRRTCSDACSAIRKREQSGRAKERRAIEIGQREALGWRALLCHRWGRAA